ncbi:MAG: RES family NAD+ phosphorylase [Roseiarcus sp.]
MFIWRISKYTDLTGRGGLAASGRWHNRPKAVVYCADEIQTAYAEILRQFHLPALIPSDFKLLKIECPPFVEVEVVNPSDLDPSWDSDTVGWRTCRPIGDDWLRSGRSALLKVPSAARAGSFNYLLKSGRLASRRRQCC